MEKKVSINLETIQELIEMTDYYLYRRDNPDPDEDLDPDSLLTEWAYRMEEMFGDCIRDDHGMQFPTIDITIRTRN